MGNFQLFPIPISMFIYLNFMKLHYPPYQPIISLSIFYPLIYNLKPISSPNKSKLTEISLPNHNDCNETLSITFLAKLIVLWAALFHLWEREPQRYSCRRHKISGTRDCERQLDPCNHEAESFCFGIFSAFVSSKIRFMLNSNEQKFQWLRARTPAEWKKVEKYGKRRGILTEFFFEIIFSRNLK